MTLMAGLAMLALGDTLETDAKIVEVSERGFILSVGSEKLTVQDDSRTKFWSMKKAAAKEVFPAGFTVHVRLKTDGSPTVIREMCDLETARWLEHIRHNVVAGSIKKIEPKRLIVALDEGGEFSYAVSEKTKFLQNGEPTRLIELKEGAHVYVKAQLQSNLDTKATEVNNRLIATKNTGKTVKKTPPVKPIKLAPAGKLTGTIQLPRIEFGMFDIVYKDTLVHITFTARTVITLMGKPATAKSIVPDLRATVTYEKDKYGRFIAGKVELIGGNAKG